MDENNNNYYQPYTPPPQPPVVTNEQVYCILSYVGILWLLGLLIRPEKYSPRVRFHVGQGIILSIVSGVLSAVTGIAATLLKAIPFGLGEFSAAILQLSTSGAMLALMVYAIVKTARREDVYLPVIGKWAFYK